MIFFIILLVEELVIFVACIKGSFLITLHLLLKHDHMFVKFDVILVLAGNLKSYTFTFNSQLGVIAIWMVEKIYIIRKLSETILEKISIPPFYAANKTLFGALHQKLSVLR